MKPKYIVFFIAVFIAIAAAFWLTFRHSPSNVADVIIAEGTQPVAAPIYVAFAKGFFKDEGLNVTLASFPTGKLCLDAVLGGKADFGTVAETPVVHAAFKKQPVWIIATMHRSRFNTFLVARKDQDIKEAKDLKGKTIAVPIGTNAEYALSAFLSKAHLAPADVKIVNLSPPEMVGPLTRGDVSAVVGWQPHIGRAETALGDDAVSFSFDDVYEETYNIVTSSEMNPTKLNKATKVLRALDRATQYMQTHQDEAIRIVAERLGMDQAEVERIWPIYRFGLDLKSSLIETLSLEGKWAVESGHQDGPVPNMRDVIFTDVLRTVKPDAVEIH